jgi:hypothetical protein
MNGRMGIDIRFWWECQKKRYHWNNLNIGRRIILRCILESLDRVVRTGLFWVRIGNIEDSCKYSNDLSASI